MSFALHHIWWLVAVILASAALALAFRTRALRLVRLAKAAATDSRLPRPVRWLFRIGVVAKLWPGPDFGVDELALGIGIILLAGPYRKVWAEIRSGIE